MKFTGTWTELKGEILDRRSLSLRMKIHISRARDILGTPLEVWDRKGYGASSGMPLAKIPTREVYRD